MLFVCQNPCSLTMKDPTRLGYQNILNQDVGSPIALEGEESPGIKSFEERVALFEVD
jgi:hypothetical protein